MLTTSAPTIRLPRLIAYALAAIVSATFTACAPVGERTAPPPRYVVHSASEVKIHDAGRNLDVTTKIYYPDARGPFPVIVFSHGLGSSKESYQFITAFWASQGYVVFVPNHDGSDTAAMIKGKSEDEIIAAMKPALTSPANLEGRPRDVAAVLDALPTLPTLVPALTGKLDLAHIGVGGHSFGAYTVMAIAGMRVNLPGKAGVTWEHPKPIAFLALSPQGPTREYDEHAWDTIARPMLVMSGTEDNQAAFLSDEKRDYRWRLQSYGHLPPGDKALVVITGAYHFTYAGGGGMKLFTGGKLADPVHLECIKAATLAWWDAELKGQTSRKDYLLHGLVEEYGAEMVKAEEK